MLDWILPEEIKKIVSGGKSVNRSAKLTNIKKILFKKLKQRAIAGVLGNLRETPSYDTDYDGLRRNMLKILRYFTQWGV